MNRSIALIPFSVLLVAGCGDILEEATERAIESETGEDIELDIDDGGISIQSSDGDVSIQTDSDGNIVLTGEDDEGERVDITADQDGNISGQVGDESFDVNVDADGGSMTVESDEGSMVSSNAIPDDFPSSIPIVGDMTVMNGTRIDDAGTTTWSITGLVDRPLSEVSDELLGALTAAGWTVESSATQEVSEEHQLTGDYGLTLLLLSQGDASMVSYQVTE